MNNDDKQTGVVVPDRGLFVQRVKFQQFDVGRSLRERFHFFGGRVEALEKKNKNIKIIVHAVLLHHTRKRNINIQDDV